MLGTCLDNVRKTTPLVHNITNYVTVNDVANILLACGASPIMSDEPEDVEDITSIESGGNILPVELVAYDMDGQEGLFVPNTAERTAMKEAAANIGGSFGTSISFARSASQQLVMDVTRGVLGGGSQYLATKMREVKVAVKANYQLLLISKKQ